VDVITQEYGKVSLVAKGARRAKNNQRYLLQAFKPVLLSWQGKTALKTLVGIEPDINDTSAQKNPLRGHRLYSAMYVNELLAYLLPENDPTDNIFQYYQHVLSQLTDDDADLESCLRYFEFNLLDELGYGINFLCNADTGNTIDEDAYYFLIQNHGFVLTTDHPEIRDKSLLGKELVNISHQTFTDASTRQTAKILSRMALKPHLRGRELKSRELFVNTLPSSTVKS
jgi:DNA repair protein RecO (recombination protein O)